MLLPGPTLQQNRMQQCQSLRVIQHARVAMRSICTMGIPRYRQLLPVAGSQPMTNNSTRSNPMLKFKSGLTRLIEDCGVDLITGCDKHVLRDHLIASARSLEQSFKATALLGSIPQRQRSNQPPPSRPVQTTIAPPQHTTRQQPLPPVTQVYIGYDGRTYVDGEPESIFSVRSPEALCESVRRI